MIAFTATLLWIKRLALITLSMVMLLFFVDLTLSNTQQVSLEIAGWFLPSLSSATLIIVPFIIGSFLGLVGAFFMVVRLRITNAHLNRKLQRRDYELQKLRSDALKGLTDA